MNATNTIEDNCTMTTFNWNRENIFTHTILMQVSIWISMHPIVWLRIIILHQNRFSGTSRASEVPIYILFKLCNMEQEFATYNDSKMYGAFVRIHVFWCLYGYDRTRIRINIPTESIELVVQRCEYFTD